MEDVIEMSKQPICKVLAGSPEEIKINFLRYVDVNQDNRPVYEINVLEFCKALSQYSGTWEEFLKEEWKLSHPEKDSNEYGESAVKELLNFVQGINQKKNQRKFDNPNYLKTFQNCETILSDNGIKCQFIKKITAISISECVDEIGNVQSYQYDVVQAVKDDIIRLCQILLESNFYHTNGCNRIFADYTPVVDIIKENVEQYEADSEKKKELLEIIEEIMQMVKSFDFPNVSSKWFEWNPNLKYYDAVFQIHRINHKYFEKVKNGELYTSKKLPIKQTLIKFNFIPC